MDALGAPVRTGVPAPQHTEVTEAELARLRAQVAWLQAERAALWWAVGHDELTGLANRRLFCTLAPALLRAGRSAVVIVLDLNGFKPINDTLGHGAGDWVLQIVAQRLASCVGYELVARLGGDEFTGVLTSPQRRPSAHWWLPAVTALAAAIAEPMHVTNQALSVTASIGVAPAQDDVPVGELLRRADLAMYHAKANGGCYAVWGRHTTDDALDARGRSGGTITAGAVSRNLNASRPPQVVEIRVDGVAGDACAPTCDPHRRDPADVAPAITYRRNDPVWVHRGGAWRPGVVESASDRAVMATYRYAAGTGTLVDTMAAEYVQARATPRRSGRGAAPPSFRAPVGGRGTAAAS